MNNLRIRKNIRLKQYNYSQNGYYFITICTKNRQNILSKIEYTNISTAKEYCYYLTKEGNIVDKYLKLIPIIYSNIELDEYIIMPNHIHMILIINQEKTNTISQIIQQLKGKITKDLGFSIWQKLFYEHIIRNNKEYLSIKQYIKNNPYNWNKDLYY